MTTQDDRIRELSDRAAHSPDENESAQILHELNDALREHRQEVQSMASYYLLSLASGANKKVRGKPPTRQSLHARPEDFESET